ncbi:bifunctional diguanylate cyclase/phosphodiesterase [uncultured Erythrobacter sp.]|uniref:putative bifunctional diguanylate cyclase/phosphodiesterase n=1 Tax=uncultured Erythrobacter sp. TaxID=263913 RepID=UPI00261D391C|nr:bifunctional diguanylate cyclase/phosphodiesterase [uncultured Erythrobacter sp.]
MPNVSAPAIIFAFACVIVLAFAGWWRNRRKLEADCQRVIDALELAKGGESAKMQFEFETTPFRNVAAALGATVEATQSRINDLVRASSYDRLTGILNAGSFRHSCKRLLSESDGKPGDGVLLYIDINDFKPINDNLGHDAGDEFLRVCAERMTITANSFKAGKLAALLNDQDIDKHSAFAGRLGGDEFAIFLPGQISNEEVEKFVFRVQRVVGEPFHVGQHALSAKMSIGVAYASEHHHCYDKLLAAADTAMYVAKSKGKGGHAIYKPTMRQKGERVLDQEVAIRTALQNGEFRLVFQPQLNLRSGTIDSCEALVRWQHPQLGQLSPDKFIPFAEKHGLIDDIGDWVIQESVRSASEWRQRGIDMRVAVNISPKQFSRVELIPFVRACLKRYELPAKLIEMEVTEAAIMDNDDVALERIAGLRRDGVQIALDDFGVGFSNFAQLLSLPFDHLKLDRSLLEKSLSSRRRRMVLSTIMDLSENLSFKVVAEGVETTGQLAHLRKINCHFAQGYLIAMPMPFDELCAFASAPKGKLGAIAA